MWGGNRWQDNWKRPWAIPQTPCVLSPIDKWEGEFERTEILSSKEMCNP